MADAVAPRVSVCMPVYNGASYIQEAIASILAQTYRDFELIVGDNCSTDRTADIVAQFGDPRIRYERNEKNLGAAGNANRCLDRARGEYVSIFHHDDVMLPENLESKVRVLDLHPNVGFVHSNMSLIDPSGAVVMPHSWSESARRDSVDDGVSIFRSTLERVHLGSSIFIGTVLARRSCYVQLGKFRPDLPHCHDTELLLRLPLYHDVACLGTPLVKYRVHPTSASSAFGDYESIGYLAEHYEAASAIFREHRGRIPDAQTLGMHMARAFAERALDLAAKAFRDGDDDTGRECMRQARRMLSGVWKRRKFWEVAGRRVAGPRFMPLFRAMKRLAGAGSGGRTAR